MDCIEAGVSAPTGHKKWLLFYCIVFSVVSFILVQIIEPEDAVSDNSPTENLSLVVTEKVQPVFVQPFPKALTEDISFLDVLFDIPPVRVEDTEDLSESMTEIDDPEVLYYPIIVRISERYHVDPLLVKAIIAVESGFDPNAQSQVGAQGLMQLMPKTAKALGVEDSFNPEHNIDGGVKYFKKLLDRFNGDVRLALAAYNAGSRKVRKYRGVPPFSETRNYIEKVCKLHSFFKENQSDEIKNVLLTQS